jgi:hypothetical protein
MATLASQTQLNEKDILYRVTQTANVTVPATQNWVALGAGELPAEVIAIGAAAQGGLTAQLAGAIGAHDLTALADNKNIVHIRDAATNQQIFDSNSREIFGLLQVGSAATEGNSFSDTGNDQPQISFVAVNPVSEGLVAVAVADIENAVIEYSYGVRTDLLNMPENAFDNTFLSAAVSSATSLSLDNAYNGGSQIDVDTANVRWDLTDNLAFQVRDAPGTTVIFAVKALGAGDEVQIIGDLNIDNTNAVDVNAGLQVDTAGTPISLGVVSGEISRAGALTITATSGTMTSTSSGNNTVQSTAGEVFLDDLRTAALPLSDASNTTLFGGATSILGAINNAGASGGVNLTKGGVTVNAGGISANTTVTSTNTTILPAFSNALVAYADSTEFVEDLLIYLNGQLQAPGTGAATNNDVYPAGTAANGEMAFEDDLFEGDVIQVIKLV